MIGRKTIAVFMVVVLGILSAIDLYLSLDTVNGNTYSEIIHRAAERFTAIPWAVGVLIGHWFWSGTRLTSVGAWALVAGCLVSLVTSNLLYGVSHPLVSLVVGLVSGRLVWGMPKGS